MYLQGTTSVLLVLYILFVSWWIKWFQNLGLSIYRIIFYRDTYDFGYRISSVYDFYVNNYDMIWHKIWNKNPVRIVIILSLIRGILVQFYILLPVLIWSIILDGGTLICAVVFQKSIKR